MSPHARARLFLGLGLALGAGCAGEPSPVTQLAGAPSEGLVFVRVDERGHHDLWRARLADGAVRPFLVTPERRETWPYWSEPAGMLVFEVAPEGRRGRHVRLWRARDAAERELPAPHRGGQGWPAWSPDGSRLAYAVGPLPSGGLAVLDLAAERVALWAVNRPGRDFVRPAFAPDGESLVAQGTEGGDARVYRLAAGQPPRPLTPAGAYAFRAKFTRDGRWVVFTDRGGEGAPSQIGAVRPDGSGLRLLAAQPGVRNERVEASPTRDEVAFVSDRDGQLDVFRMDFPDGEPRNLTRGLDLEAGPLYWSPDGERIAVGMEPREGSAPAAWLVVVIDRHGRELLRTPGFSPDWMPPWPGR